MFLVNNFKGEYMFDLNKTYGYDDKKAGNGVKMVIGQDENTDYILVKKMPSPAYRAKLTALMMANKKTLDILKTQDQEAHEKKDNELLCEIIAETVIGGWGAGFADMGESIPFSTAAAKAILVKYPQFKSDIIDFATNLSNYQAEPDVADIKKK
jgi:hypothetical protein